MKDVFVYILTNDRLTTLYIGVTNDHEGRHWQHQNGEGSKFADHSNLKRLIYYENDCGEGPESANEGRISC